MAAASILRVPTRSASLMDHPMDTRAAPIIVFDVNETLLDFGVLVPVFDRIFGEPGALRTWFNHVILYSEALTLSGEYADSGTVGVAVLRMLAQASGRAVAPADLDELRRISAEMPTYADTPKALADLKSAGYRLVTLSNNPAAAVEAQLTQAGIRPFFDTLHSIDDRVRRYKPALESYTDLAATLGVAPSDLWLVSCHAFDTLGAAAAGYRTALVLRPGNAPVALGRAPGIVADDLSTVADRIVLAGAGRGPSPIRNPSAP
ncbi:haloacid dehalogenase type II [Methylobacterium sp. J-077]|uniref:haloacid dehalogenase type II n=1 Tax=Methylobacterium sp. J-077 TaxID=2836656 RepID=UPI001FBA9F2C|nr:haloacid dehalogenase type II [Methylobacterium sp. J-077]MCJ2121398.1 haloacid dehalogenase type II [Methylobacterium sp. J-077]